MWKSSESSAMLSQQSVKNWKSVFENKIFQDKEMFFKNFWMQSPKNLLCGSLCGSQRPTANVGIKYQF